jgi:hypothetical protein
VIPTATASSGFPPRRECCRKVPSTFPPPRTASAIASRLLAGTRPKIFPTSLVSNSRAHAIRDAATVSFPHMRRAYSTCMIASAGDAGSNRITPPSCPSRNTPNERQPRQASRCNSTNSSGVLGEKSSHACERAASSHAHASGQYIAGNGSTSSMAIYLGIRPAASYRL